MSLTIGAVAFDSEVARALVAALDADLDVRYAEDDVAFAHLVPDEAMLSISSADLVPPAGTFLVARHNGEPVGCVALRPAPTGEAGVAEIKRMYVAPEARGRGVSRSLLEAVEAAAADLAYRRIILETGTRQPEALALYESAGYEPIADYGAYREFPASRCMAKDL